MRKGPFSIWTKTHKPLLLAKRHFRRIGCICSARVMTGNMESTPGFCVKRRNVNTAQDTCFKGRLQSCLASNLLVLISSYLRLLRSRSSVSKSKSGCGVSLGPWDCNTDELDDMTVVWPEGWMVLNWNWGPIHRRLWGPVCVTISTWKRDGIVVLMYCALQRSLHKPCTSS